MSQHYNIPNETLLSLFKFYQQDFERICKIEMKQSKIEKDFSKNMIILNENIKNTEKFLSQKFQSSMERPRLLFNAYFCQNKCSAIHVVDLFSLEKNNFLTTFELTFSEEKQENFHLAVNKILQKSINNREDIKNNFSYAVRRFSCDIEEANLKRFGVNKFFYAALLIWKLIEQQFNLCSELFNDSVFHVEKVGLSKRIQQVLSMYPLKEKNQNHREVLKPTTNVNSFIGQAIPHPNVQFLSEKRYDEVHEIFKTDSTLHIYYPKFQKFKENNAESMKRRIEAEQNYSVYCQDIRARREERLISEIKKQKSKSKVFEE